MRGAQAPPLWHKDYGPFDDATRKEIVAIAEEIGLTDAAFHFNIHRTTIGKWKKRLKEGTQS